MVGPWKEDMLTTHLGRTILVREQPGRLLAKQTHFTGSHGCFIEDP
jgi:hypothetical protein